MTSKTRLLANLITNTGDVKSAGLDNVVTPDTGLEVYSTLDSLPTSNLSAGDQSWVSENNRLYISNGSGWYNLAATNAALTDAELDEVIKDACDSMERERKWEEQMEKEAIEEESNLAKSLGIDIPTLQRWMKGRR